MMSLQPVSSPPRWLSLCLLCGGMVAAGAVMLFGQHGWSMKTSLWEIGMRCGCSLIVLMMGLALALCLGVATGLSARRMGARMERFVALLGRALACVPVVVLVWGFIAGWIGRLGWPVESLMPAQFPGGQDSWQVTLAHVIWEYLAPALILALPLCGEMIHAFIADGRAVLDLDFSLRARGVPQRARLWRHHLGQLWPLLAVRLQALCLLAPVYLIIVEDALHFRGWGEWMAHSLRAGEALDVALGFACGGAMLALLCLPLQRGGVKPADRWVVALAWQPWLLWALGLLALLPASLMSWIILWAAVLVAGCAGWRQTWNHLMAELPVEAARMLGAPESMIWRNHIALVQCRMLAAWICSLFAQTLLGMAAACAVLPRLVEALGGPLAKLCRPLASATAEEAMQKLAEPTVLLQSGGIIVLAALCLMQVSRIVQPRLS